MEEFGKESESELEGQKKAGAAEVGRQILWERSKQARFLRIKKTT